MAEFRATTKNEHTTDSGVKKSSSRQNVSFKFTKHSAKRLPSNKFSDELQFDGSDRESILAVECNKIESVAPKEEKKPLVIPAIQKNVWRKSSKGEKPFKKESSTPDAIRDLAIKELLEDSAKENERWEKRDSKQAASLPMVIQNKIPEGFETDTKLNVELRAEESTLENYEQIPIEEFGAAVLRGFGCNPGDPMGNKNKKFVKPIEAVLRSKGLGLGADTKKSVKSIQQSSKGDDLKLVAGAYVHIMQGQHEGTYGQVEGLDEARAIVRVDRESRNISLPLLYIQVISKKEYQKESRVINKKSYEKYRKEQESRNGVQESREEFSLVDGISSKIKDDPKEHSTDSSSTPHKKKKHERDTDVKHKEGSQTQNWVSPLLRVRLVDSKYKNGKYYKQKVTVEDVLSHDNCVCRTEDGKYLENISADMLETVIPRSEPGYVMIVDGKYKRQIGIILKRDKTNCIATVQFLSDRQKVTKLSYDSICEYVGDISQFD